MSWSMRWGYCSAPKRPGCERRPALEAINRELLGGAKPLIKRRNGNTSIAIPISG